MTITDGALLIAGYVLAHAGYSVSDLERGGLLIPCVVAETNGQQQVLRFESNTQEQAISETKLKVTELQKSVDIYAWAREGTMHSPDGNVYNVLSVTAWALGLEHEVTIVQTFTPVMAKACFEFCLVH